jgi:hypothetical protein
MKIGSAGSLDGGEYAIDGLIGTITITGELYLKIWVVPSRLR